MELRMAKRPSLTLRALRSCHLSLSYRLYGKYLWCACCDGQLQHHPARYAIMRQTYPIVEYVEEGNAIYHLCARAIDLRAQAVSNAWKQETW
jgi:hypothetical protein